MKHIEEKKCPKCGSTMIVTTERRFMSKYVEDEVFFEYDCDKCGHYLSETKRVIKGGVVGDNSII